MAEPGHEPFEDRFWRAADGLRLHARDYPAIGGETRLPVICLHGLTRNARDFDALAPAIASSGRRVLAADVRGRGDSERDPGRRYTMHVYADDVIEMARALGVDRAVVLGTSMGGLIAMELATIAPDLVAAAIVNDVGPVLDPIGLARIMSYVGTVPERPDWPSAADYLRRLNATALPHYRADDWMRMARRTFRADAVAGVVPDYDPAILVPTRAAPTTTDPWLGWTMLAENRPLLLLRGALSDLLSADTAERMTTGRPNILLAQVPEVGHAPMLDEPVAIKAIDDFLARVP